MKPEKASLHAPKVRFMARSAASYGEAVLHKPPCQMKHLLSQIWSSFISFRYEASPLRSDMMRKWKNESLLPENALIRIKSPQILRYKRSPDLRRRKKITWSTLHLYVLLPPTEQADFPPQIGVSLVGRNVIKVSHKIKKILWPLTGWKVQIAIATVYRLPKTIFFCLKSIFCKAK